MENCIFAEVAVSAAVYSIDRPYTYAVPRALAGRAVPGARVVVPFGRGNRRCEGIVLTTAAAGDAGRKLKPVEEVLDDAPALSEEMLKLALWMRGRFFCTFYDAVHAMLPAGMWYRDGGRMIGDKTQKFVFLTVPAEEAVLAAGQKKRRAPQQSAVLTLMASIGDGPASDVKCFTGASSETLAALEKQGYIGSETREVFRRPSAPAEADAGPVILNAAQEEAFRGLGSMMDSGKAGAALLYGVTGSGKTAIYLRLVEKALEKGKSAVVLVPEIGLTPQFVEIFSSHFGDGVAVLHSSLSMGERYDEWKRIRSGSVRVVIGTRSAVFAPLSDIGLIIIDEEQERTYKSENPPRYHTREVAKYRCVRHGALLVMGSATPSVESMYFAGEGRYRLFTLAERYNERPLPRVIVADMRSELRSGNGGAISSVLRTELEKNIASGEQSILFINRRGASGLVVCGECGYTYTCPNCSVPMTYHSVGQRLMCHYCGHTESVPERCPECGGKLNFVGAGTQKVEEELRGLFPGAGVIRMDTDTVSGSGSHERLLSRFRNERVPILLGTQMVTKGLDFENVTLVGVLSADQSLYISDFRARERTFSLITQVVGRSGRGAKEGRAVIQTFTPGNEIIALASKQDYMSFYEREISLRRVMNVPPAAELFAVTASGAAEAAVLRGCVGLRDMLTRALPADASVLGPAPASVLKVSGRYRYRIYVACSGNARVRGAIADVVREFSDAKENRGVSVSADADPME